MASEDHGQWRGTRKRQWEVEKKRKREMGNKRETVTETKRMRRREKKITNREEQSEKGKTFVTLSYRTLGRKNNIINLLTFQYCINLSSGILWAH